MYYILSKIYGQLSRKKQFDINSSVCHSKCHCLALFENPKPSSSAAINTAKQFYGVCMDVAELNKKGSSELLKKIEEFGYWPAVHDSQWHQNNLANLLKNVSKSRFNNLLNMNLDFVFILFAQAKLSPTSIYQQKNNLHYFSLFFLLCN